MAYVVMAYVVMAYVVMACIVMAYIVMACGLVVFCIDLSQSVTCDSNCCWSCSKDLNTFQKVATLMLQHAAHIFVINDGCE